MPSQSTIVLVIIVLVAYIAGARYPSFAQNLGLA